MLFRSADYYAFNAAYGAVNSAFMSLATIAASVAQIKPILDPQSGIHAATVMSSSCNAGLNWPFSK